MNIKKTAGIFFTALAIIIVFAMAHFLCPGKLVKVVIPKGATARQAAEALKEKNIIMSATWFRIAVKISGTGKKIMPGSYMLRTHMSSEEALHTLITTIPMAETVDVNFPEGWRVEQVAERLQANGVISDSQDFIRLAKEHGKEGYLFPSTYQFKKNISSAEAMKVFTKEFEKQIRPLFDKGFREGMDEKKVMIIASIVEREAVVDSERPMIATVYLNRLKKRMKLEADPTTQYALGYQTWYENGERKEGWWKKGITLKDLRTESPYNTYYTKTLPPGPICSPGKGSIEAAMNPLEGFDALYFVATADGTGRHTFNKNFREHLGAKKVYKTNLRNEKKQN
jgi:UPF0755 protein